jgi:hypothetical protein
MHIQFDQEWMVDIGENQLFVLDMLLLFEANDLLFAEDLHAHVLACNKVATQLDFAKGSSAKCAKQLEIAQLGFA